MFNQACHKCPLKDSFSKQEETFFSYGLEFMSQSLNRNDALTSRECALCFLRRLPQFTSLQKIGKSWKTTWSSQLQGKYGVYSKLPSAPELLFPRINQEGPQELRSQITENMILMHHLHILTVSLCASVSLSLKWK